MWQRHCCNITSRERTNRPLQQSLVIVEGTVEMSDVLLFAGAVCGVHGHGASDINWWKYTSDTFSVCCFSHIHACKHQSPSEENMQPCMSKAAASWRGCEEADEYALPRLKGCLRGNMAMTATKEPCEQRLALLPLHFNAEMHPLGFAVWTQTLTHPLPHNEKCISHSTECTMGTITTWGAWRGEARLYISCYKVNKTNWLWLESNYHVIIIIICHLCSAHEAVVA